MSETLQGPPVLGRSDDASTLPFVRLSPDEAASLLSSNFGLTATSTPLRLATERDDTFHVRAAQGEFIFKVAHPNDDPAAIDLQTAALNHAAGADRTLPLQQVIPTLQGEAAPQLPMPAGPARVTRVLTYLSGEILRHHRPTSSQLQACGRMQARLAVALSSFDHPAADRHLLFDLQRFDELRAVKHSPAHRLIADVFRWSEEVLAPRVHELPVQVLHNDFGLDNVLVDPSSPDFVCGILDWGDTVRTWRAADLASGLASQVAVDGPAWAPAAQMVAGYRSVTELAEVELDLLPGLVAMRIAQRLLMAERLSASMSGNTTYLRLNVDFSYQQLANLDR